MQLINTAYPTSHMRWELSWIKEGLLGLSPLIFGIVVLLINSLAGGSMNPIYIVVVGAMIIVTILSLRPP